MPSISTASIGRRDGLWTYLSDPRPDDKDVGCRSGKKEASVLRWHESAINCVRYSPDGLHFASGSERQHGLRLGNCQKSSAVRIERTRSRSHNKSALFPGWASLGERLTRQDAARVGHGNGITGAVLRGHVDAVDDFDWTPDGHRIVSAGAYEDTTVRIWDAQTHECLEVIPNTNDIGRFVSKGNVSRYRFLQDSRYETVFQRQPDRL